MDHYWAELTAGGGEPGSRGWLKDPCGVSWRGVPAGLAVMLQSGEASGPGYERAFRTLLGMTRIDVAALETAYQRNG